MTNQSGISQLESWYYVKAPMFELFLGLSKPRAGFGMKLRSLQSPTKAEEGGFGADDSWVNRTELLGGGERSSSPRRGFAVGCGMTSCAQMTGCWWHNQHILVVWWHARNLDKQQALVMRAEILSLLDHSKPDSKVVFEIEIGYVVHFMHSICNLCKCKAQISAKQYASLLLCNLKLVFLQRCVTAVTQKGCGTLM